MLIDDDIENVFPSSYAWWTATERKCWGDGTSATRRTAEKPGGQPWTTCGSGCPELASGQCKPGGDLHFVLADFPRLGSVCRIHTCSYRSIRQVHSALQEIQTFTGGRLAGITAKLTARPEEATYFDRKEKRKRTSSIWVLSLEVEGDDMRKLIANLTENARLFAETRKLLGSGGGKVLEVVEDEQEQAPEVAAEFYPASANRSSAAEGAAAASPPDTILAVTTPQVTTKPLPPESNSTRNGGNRSAMPPTDAAASPPANNNGNGSAGSADRELLSSPRLVGYLLNGQLQGKLLSAYKISQAFPGVPGQRYACYSPACGRSRGQYCTDRAYPLIRVVLHSRVTLPKPADCEAAVIGVALT